MFRRMDDAPNGRFHSLPIISLKFETKINIFQYEGITKCAFVCVYGAWPMVLLTKLDRPGCASPAASAHRSGLAGLARMGRASLAAPAHPWLGPAGLACPARANPGQPLEQGTKEMPN